MALRNNRLMPCSVQLVDSLQSRDNQFDCLLILGSTKSTTVLGQDLFSARSRIDEAFEQDVSLLECAQAPGGRIIYSPVGKLSDYDDVRSYAEAASKAIRRAVRAGCKAPILVLPCSPRFENSELISLLGAFAELYLPLQLREATAIQHKAKTLGVYSESKRCDLNNILKFGQILESARYFARDIGGSDPERMSPPNVVSFVLDHLKQYDCLKVSVVDKKEDIEKKYPLFEAVNRCASHIERHQGRIIRIEYKPDSPKKTLFFIGKGVTYDTGGADVKAGGVMAGMSRDKCGAATVAGLMLACALIRPKNVHVVGYLPLVRNSIGSDCYVADEIIVARSGQRVLIGNTDAEGRMIMADPLCEAREQALAWKSPNTHIYSIATLTGHACLAAGTGYSIILDNAVAKKEGHALKLQEVGEDYGDPFEISTLRKDDFEFHTGKGQAAEILQANNLPSSRTARGHQSPAAFLMMASGLDKCGFDSQNPLKYTHLDIAASAGDVPHDPTGSTIVALTKLHFLD